MDSNHKQVRAFDHVNLYTPNVSYDSKRTTLTTTSSLKNWVTQKVAYPFIESGTVYCEFEIKNILSNYLTTTRKCVIGIADYQNGTTDYPVGLYNISYGFAATGEIVSMGEYTKYSDGYAEGDIVGVLVDMDKNEISFYKNGKCLGLAFSNIEAFPIYYCFTVSLQRSHMSVKVLSFVAPRETLCDPAPTPEIQVPSFNFTGLPYDVQMDILDNLSTKELTRNRVVCQDWCKMLDSDYFWKKRVGNVLGSRIANEDILSSDEPISGEVVVPKSIPYAKFFRENIFRFSEINKSGAMDVSKSGLRISPSSSASYWSSARVDYPEMTSGVHYCEFRVDTYRHGSIGNTWKIICGVVTESFQYHIREWIGIDGQSYGYIADSGRKVGPTQTSQGESYSESYREHDCIGVLADFNQNKLEFFKNGISMGVAFHDFVIPNQKHYFAVAIARWGIKVSILPSRCSVNVNSECI